MHWRCPASPQHDASPARQRWSNTVWTAAESAGTPNSRSRPSRRHADGSPRCASLVHCDTVTQVDAPRVGAAAIQLRSAPRRARSAAHCDAGAHSCISESSSAAFIGRGSCDTAGVPPHAAAAATTKTPLRTSPDYTASRMAPPARADRACWGRRFLVAQALDARRWALGAPGARRPALAVGCSAFGSDARRPALGTRGPVLVAANPPRRRRPRRKRCPPRASLPPHITPRRDRRLLTVI